MRDRPTTLRKSAIVVAACLLAFIGGFLAWSHWARPVVDFRIWGGRYGLGDSGRSPEEKLYFDSSGTALFTVAVRNTGRTDAPVWIVVSAKNATIAYEGEARIERTEAGIRIMSTVKGDIDWRVLFLKVSLEEYPPSLVIAASIEKRIEPSLTAASVWLGELNCYCFSSGLYVLADRKDNMAVYTLIDRSTSVPE